MFDPWWEAEPDEDRRRAVLERLLWIADNLGYLHEQPAIYGHPLKREVEVPEAGVIVVALGSLVHGLWIVDRRSPPTVGFRDNEPYPAQIGWVPGRRPGRRIGAPGKTLRPRRKAQGSRPLGNHSIPHPRLPLPASRHKPATAPQEAPQRPQNGLQAQRGPPRRHTALSAPQPGWLESPSTTPPPPRQPPDHHKYHIWYMVWGRPDQPRNWNAATGDPSGPRRQGVSR